IRRHTRFSRDWSSDVCSSDLRSGNQDDDEPGRVRVEGVVRPVVFVRHDRQDDAGDGDELQGGTDVRFGEAAGEVVEAALDAEQKIGCATRRTRVECAVVSGYY